MTDAFTRQLLEAHNRYRDLHQAPPLIYDRELGRSAQRWADTIAKKDRLEHDPKCQDDRIGENVAMKYSSEKTDFSGSDFTDYWYSEIADYDFNAENQVKCGHFTQVVWKATDRAGFGRAISASGKVYVVGRYSPGGNYINQFVKNVAPPKDGKVRIPESMLSGNKSTPSSGGPKSGPSGGSTTNSSATPLIGAKSSSDVLVSSTTVTRTDGGKKIETVTEKYRCADGSVYTRERETTFVGAKRS